MMAEPEDRRSRNGSLSDDDPESHPNESDAADGGAQGEPLRCGNCGTEIPAGARSCPVCRHGVYRTCYCGWRLPANQPRCPNCGADWTQAKRVARKSRSKTAKARGAVRAALLGSLIAAAAAFVVYAIVTGFAAMAVDEQGSVPQGAGDRLSLALSGVGRLLGRVGSFFVEHGATIALVVGIMAVGAAAGVVWHVLQRGRHKEHSERTARRVRRKRLQ